MENVLFMRKAKEQLVNNWTNGLLGTLIYVAIMAAASCTYVGELILTGPLTFGYVLFIGCLIDTKTTNLNLLFRGFDRFVETLIAGLLVSLAVSVGLAFLIVPGLILSCGFGMTFYIMADDANISGLDAMKMSWNMMNGHKWNFFCLQLRFFGWALLCILTCGVGLLWLMPYTTAANLNFYRQLRYGTF